MLGLYRLEVCPPLFLRECLSQNRLVPLVPLFLGVNVIEVVAFTRFAEEGLVFVLFLNLVILDLL